jgi:hypothetical protein
VESDGNGISAASVGLLRGEEGPLEDLEVVALAARLRWHCPKASGMSKRERRKSRGQEEREPGLAIVKGEY